MPRTLEIFQLYATGLTCLSLTWQSTAQPREFSSTYSIWQPRVIKQYWYSLWSSLSCHFLSSVQLVRHQSHYFIAWMRSLHVSCSIFHRRWPFCSAFKIKAQSPAHGYIDLVPTLLHQYHPCYQISNCFRYPQYMTDYLSHFHISQGLHVTPLHIPSNVYYAEGCKTGSFIDVGSLSDASLSLHFHCISKCVNHSCKPWTLITLCTMHEMDIQSEQSLIILVVTNNFDIFANWTTSFPQSFTFWNPCSFRKLIVRKIPKLYFTLLCDIGKHKVDSDLPWNFDSTLN